MPRSKSIALYWGIQDYMKLCKMKERSPETLRWYLHKLETFRLYMAQVQHIASVGSVEYRHVQAFFYALRHTHTHARVSDATVKGYIQVLKGFFKWCEAQGYSRYNPAKIAGDLWLQRNQGWEC